MSNLEVLYDRIEDEYYGLRDEWREYEFEDIMADVERIAKLKSVFNYIKQHEPFSENQAVHFLKMENPLQFICDRYNPIEEEVHEEYKTVIDDIYDNGITNMQDCYYYAELKWKMFQEKEKYEEELRLLKKSLKK